MLRARIRHQLVRKVGQSKTQRERSELAQYPGLLFHLKAFLLYKGSRLHLNIME